MAMIVKDSIKELLGLETEVSEIEYSKNGLKRHLEKRKHYDVLKYLNHIKDYVGLNTNGNKMALEYVKCYKKNILLVLKINRTKDKFFIISMYSINDYKLNSRKFSGRLRKVDKK